MNYDALTLAAVRQALEAELLHGRVQRIVRPTRLSLGLELYARRRHELYLSAEPQAPTALLAGDKLRRGVETASPLLLLLRKYVDGARLEAIEQPELERVLWLWFTGEHGRVALVCELMGRLSNLILMHADGTILDAVKRVGAEVNRVRTVLPGMAYVPPPAQAKLHPLQLDADDWAREVMAVNEGPLWRRLVQVAFGISPLLARELAFRATGSVQPSLPLDAAAWQRLSVVVQELLHLPETAAWSPCVAYEGQGPARRLSAYAPYALTHLGEVEPVETVWQALARYRAAQAAGAVTASPLADPYFAARRRVHVLIADQVGRLEGRLASLRAGLVPEDELRALEWRATAILALAWQVRPGQTELLAAPYALSGLPEDEARPPVSIPLDPRLSAAQNAQALFHEYRKRQAAAQQVPERIAQTELELAFLRQADTDVDLSADRPQLDEVERALAAAGYGPRRASPRTRPRPSEPLRRHAPDGTLVLVGRNSTQNEEVTFHRSAPDDLWLHAHGIPGGHVIVRCAGQPVSPETLAWAAGLAARYSAARGEPRVQVDYTARHHVRPIKGAGPGMVTYREERTLWAEPAREEGSHG